MILYHGSTLEIPRPLILKSDQGRDFGYAFYTTDIQEQAERWALRRSRLLARKSKQAVLPIVNVYEYSPTADLSIRCFAGISMEWLEMVVACRSHPATIHGYDIVQGKIANDSVGETVQYVVQGIMRKEDAMERLRFEKINNQVAFCTERSLRTLTFRSSYIVKEA